MTVNKPTSPTIQRALISVSDKSGLAEFAHRLADKGIEIFSTGGTRQHLTENGLNVRDVTEYTGFPEIMDGRVKTLHPKIFGGILCRHDHDPDIEVTNELEILPIELVVVNLYPFEQTIARHDVTRQMAIENIDIGGPSLVRAAAKNHAFVTVATSSDQYNEIAEQVEKDGHTSLALRQRLMADAFEHTANYDRNIANYFSEPDDPKTGPVTSRFAPQIQLSLTKSSDLRYGENSHQSAALYEISGDPPPSVAAAHQHNGKELSFNNLLDMDAALSIVGSFDQPACVVMKHNNPCGAASARVDGDSLANVVDRAFQGDPVSAFGSIVGVNRTVDFETAEFLASGNFFVELIIAPRFDDRALEILKTKPKWKKNVRLMTCPLPDPVASRLDYRRVLGGMLVQEVDSGQANTNDWEINSNAELPPEIFGELAFAWNMVRFVKSNAIVLGKQQSLCGVGAGQMSRVDSVRIAIDKAGERASGSVLASDAFFPFPDSIEMAARAGIRAVIQPGGSVKDDEVVAACRSHDIPMIMTGRRHFLH